MGHPSLLAFDVNETLLDMMPLLARVEEVIGAPAGEWFTRTLHASLVANETATYRPFDQLGVDALLAMGRNRGLAVLEPTAIDVVETMTRLPAKAGIYNSLERLFDAGYAMVALTNGSTRVANAQIENAGLHIFMQRVISVEEVRLFKPASEVYLHAASVMGTPVRDMMMVAAHDWDCAGAMACLARAAYVSSGLGWHLPGPAPEWIGVDLSGLAEILTG